MNQHESINVATRVELSDALPVGLSIVIYMPIWYYVVIKRTALFLKEQQINKLRALSNKTGAPVAELIRRAIERYLQERAKELK
jgi:hypothetical protein